MKRTAILLSALALFGLSTFSANAQQYKYQTPMPPGVLAPDTLDTRFGTLKLFGGFPDKPSVDKLYDNLDFQRAVQAYLLGLPVVNQVGNRDNILKIGPANTTIPIWETMVDSRTIELTANDNTPYTWFWVDLHGGPLVIEAPPKVLGLVDDIWYSWIGDIGFTGPDRGEGGKYLLLPPGYKGEVPPGYFVLRPGSYSVWAVWRSFLVEGNPKPGVDLVKKSLKVYRLADAANPPTLNFVDMSGKPFNMLAPADYTFWELLNKVVQEEPTDTIDATTLGFWASVGIMKGKSFAPDERMKKILTEAAAVGDATARAIVYRWRGADGYWYPDTIKNFWSVIVYDNQTRSMMQTDQRFPSVSSQTKGLKVNNDGSVDVYFGPTAPAGEEKNWAQTIPGKSWNILLRLYGPLQPFFDKTWRPGEIELQS